MSIKKLSTLCFAALALASSAGANAQIANRLVATPASSSSNGGVAAVAIPIQNDVCTVSNNKCGGASVGAVGSASSIRPWTSYFSGQSINTADSSGLSYSVGISIGSNGYVYVGSNPIGTPVGYEAVVSAGSYTVKQGSNIYVTVGTSCKVYPTWASEAIRLRGDPPTSWSSSGCATSYYQPGAYIGGD